MARREQARNSCGRFMCKDEEDKRDKVAAAVTITREEATAMVFAAAALVHIAENPSIYPADLVADAKKHKAAMITLANKVKEFAYEIESESIAEDVRRLNLAPTVPRP